jgi:phosphohistidine phosphatase
MKTLLIMRHAESSSNFLGNDFDRPLTKNGELEALIMAKKIKDKAIKIDAIISSNAHRTTQTASIIAEKIEFDITKINWHSELYHAPPSKIIKCIEACENKINTLLIVCHNPGITDFVNKITRFITPNMPTAGMVAVTLNIDDWSEFSIAKTELLFFDYPTNFI